jgi:predicted short-subunit dehydrogenase-like oxidoreductase (DUF2520 family)
VAADSYRARIAILGCGAVGGAFAEGIARGWKRARRRGEVWLWSRHASRARKLGHALACPTVRARVLGAPEEALGASEAVLLCLPDAVIVPMAERLARSLPRGRRVQAPVLHTNGLLGAEALVALRRKGVAVGKLHPLWAANRGSSFLGEVSFGIEGDPGAERAARAILRWVGGRAAALQEGTGPEYHAAASLLSGGLVALYELADRLFRRAVPGRDARRRALDMLAKTALSNVWVYGTKAALTGAISRGAEDTVRGHLRALRRTPDALEAYRVLGRTMLELARARGSVDASSARRLARLLGVRARRR